MSGITGFRCRACKSLWFPERLACPHCYNRDLVREDVREGVVVSSTLRGDGEIAIATVEIPGGARVVGQLKGSSTISSRISISKNREVGTGLYVPDGRELG